jgi:hypothetical protein
MLLSGLGIGDLYRPTMLDHQWTEALHYNLLLKGPATHCNCSLKGQHHCNLLLKWTTPYCNLLLKVKGVLGNWPHYYRVVRSELVFHNVLTTSINNSHIKRKNYKTICSSETFSSRIFGSAPNSPNTRCHLFDWVSLTSLWHSHRRVHSASSTFTFFKLANCTRVAYCVCNTRYLGNAMHCRFSISALGSVYNARCKPNLPTVSNMKLPAAETDYWSGISLQGNTLKDYNP